MTSVSIGNELKDSFKETSNWVNNNVQFLSDVEQFYRQRIQIEREYSSQLQKLTSEYLKKKANRSIAVSVGDEPKITPGSLESATLVAWTEVLSKTEAVAKNHDTFANELNFKVADQILSLQRSTDAMQQRLLQFYQGTLLKKKDDIFEQVTRAKKSYDESCESMESNRAKSEKSFNKEKYQKKAHEKEVDMNIAKNNYLLKINIANRIKDKFYYQDLPEVLDLFQDLNEFKTMQWNFLLTLGSTAEINMENKNIELFNAAIKVIGENNPQLDTQMFIKHNVSQWAEPQDFYYIPSSIWHDDEQFRSGDEEVQALRRNLVLAHKSLSQVDESLESGRERLNSLSTQKAQWKGKSINEFEIKPSLDLVNQYLVTLSQFVIEENSKVSAQVEIETIENNVGDKDLSIDNLTVTTKKRGFFSRLKGASAEKDVVRDSSDAFDDSRSIMSSQTSKSHHSTHFKLGSLLRPRTTSVSTSATGGDPIGASSGSSTLQGTAMYAYEAQGDDELSLQAGETFNVIVPDDGSGWTEVTINGAQGLVPTSYIQVSTVSTPSLTKKKGPEVTPRRGAKKIQYCVAKFPYTAEDDTELTIAEGDRIEVIKGDDGGWTTGDLGGRTGLFPTSYVEFQ